MTTMRSWITSILLWLIAQPALAEWAFVESWIDPINEFELRAATTTSDSGIKLYLYRNPSGRVYVLFTLPEGGPGFAASGIVAQVTPKGFKTKDIEIRDEPGRFVEYGFSTGRMLRARLWHGQGETPTIGTLLDVLTAPSVHGAFQMDDGSSQEAVWSMDGASLPIAQALGIKIDGVAAGPEWEDTASRALMAAMTACQFPKLDMLCVQLVTTCSTKISEDRDIKGFEGCIAGSE